MYGQQQPNMQGMYPPQQQQQQQQQGYPAGQYPGAYQQQQPNNPHNMMMNSNMNGNNNMNMNSNFNPGTNPNMYGGGSMQQPPQNNNNYQQQHMYQPNTNMNTNMNQQNFNQQPNMNNMNANQQYNVNPNSQQSYTTTANDFHPLSQPNTGYQHSSQTHNHAQQPHAQQQSYSNPAMGRPPYIDPETQIVYQCTNPEHEGWLTKQSMWLKDWRRRYFILCGSKLFFAKNPYAAPHGMMDLGTATTVKSADIKSGKKHSFEISTHDHMYFMYADSEKEKDDWIGSVGRAIVRSSGTFLSQKDVKGAGTATGNKGTMSSGGVNGTRGGSTSNAYGYGEDDDDDDDIYDGVFENSENHPYFND